MFKLCVKDYFAARWFWLMILALFLVVAAQAVSFRSGVVLILSPGLVLAWLAISDVIDDKNGAARLYASLPLTRRTIVRGRYLLAGGMTLAAAAAVFGTIWAAPFLPRISVPDAVWHRLFSIESLAGFFAASIALFSLYLPVVFALGPGKTAVVFPAVLAAAAAAVFGLERLGAAVFGFSPVLFAPGFWRDPAGRASEILAAARAGGLAAFGTALLLAVAVLAGSLALAVQAFERREF
jgi:hypothetical protein